MNRIVLLVVTTFFALGCSKPKTVTTVPIPPRGTIEVYATTTTPGPGTQVAVDPTTKASINLVVPPVITNVDIATVALANVAMETSGGGETPESIPGIEIVLNPAGAAKMLAATTAPTSPNVAVLVNGEVISVPTIVTPINTSFRVTGDPSDEHFMQAISKVTGQPSQL